MIWGERILIEFGLVTWVDGHAFTCLIALMEICLRGSQFFLSNLSLPLSLPPLSLSLRLSYLDFWFYLLFVNSFHSLLFLFPLLFVSACLVIILYVFIYFFLFFLSLQSLLFLLIFGFFSSHCVSLVLSFPLSFLPSFPPSLSAAAQIERTAAPNTLVTARDPTFSLVLAQSRSSSVRPQTTSVHLPRLPLQMHRILAQLLVIFTLPGIYSYCEKEHLHKRSQLQMTSAQMLRIFS